MEIGTTFRVLIIMYCIITLALAIKVKNIIKLLKDQSLFNEKINKTVDLVDKTMIRIDRKLDSHKDKSEDSFEYSDNLSAENLKDEVNLEEKLTKFEFLCVIDNVTRKMEEQLRENVQALTPCDVRVYVKNAMKKNKSEKGQK